MKIKAALVKVLLTFIVLLTSVSHVDQSKSKMHYNAYDIERQAVAHGLPFNRLQHGTKDSTKGEMLEPNQMKSKGLGRMKNDQLQTGKFQHSSNNDISTITDRDLKAMSSMKHASFKIQQKPDKNTRRVRKDVESRKPWKEPLQQREKCEVPSRSCQNCCDISKNCTYKATLCRCDTRCTFYDDCCADYEKFCGKRQNNSFGVDPQGLSCTRPNYVDMKSEFGEIWIINKCPRDRKNEEISHNCENADKLEWNVSNIQNFVPVIGENNLIFRNEFCAKCNGITQFDYFGFDMKCYVVPPSSITSFAELVEFASRYCEPQEGIAIFRDDYQQIRECNQDFRHFCDTSQEIARSLVKDSRRLVSLTAVLRFQNGPSGSEVEQTMCLGGRFYDDYLETCRYGESMHLVKENLDKYHVAVWLDISEGEYPSPDEIASSFAKLFNFQRSQVSNLGINYLDSFELLLLIIVFNLALTNEQTLLLAKANYTTTNNTVSETENSDPMSVTNGLPLHRLLFFSRKFNVTLNRIHTVHKTTSRQLACIRKRTFPQGTYASTRNGKYYYINSTGESFPKKQVFFEGVNISVCEKIVFSACVGRRVNLTSEEYVKFDNLSIFYNRTNTIYHFGEYDIEDGDIFMCIREGPHRYFVSYPDNSVVVQIYLTVICFVLSLTCLFLVIQTYLIFPELRTLPGKNLLSLSVSLFLAQLLWLIPDQWYPSILCHVIAAIKHYVFLVSFVAMATIAWHTHSVFACKNVRKDSSKNRERKKFYKYSAVVWGVPATFVVACAVIDWKDVYAIYVNEQRCWFDNAHAQQYLFVVPVGLLLLFNVIFFALTVFRIQHVRASTRLVHSDRNPRKMFWIYLKISALMGFSWLFGFIYLFAKSIQVFSYLFVIFGSLQGVYIALAFVVKKEIWDKYKKLMQRKHVTKFKPDYQSTLQEELSKSRETKV